MKKRLFTAVLAAALTMTSFAAVPTAQAAGNADDTSASTGNAQTKNYWIFYKNIDTTEIDRIAVEKQHDYEYSLYETETDQREIERKSVDYYQKIRLEMLKEAFADKSAEILTELGADASNAWCSQFAPTIVCALTDEQYEKAKAMDIITGIDLYEPLNIEPTTDLKDALVRKEEILNKYTRDNEGNSVCDDNVKFDVVLNAGKDNKTDYLVVYGLKSKEEISKVKAQLDKRHFWENPTMELYSGVTLYDIAVSQGNVIRPVIFVEDAALGWASPISLKDYSEQVNFDVAPYIVSLGDGNGDGRVNAVDASEALSLYAKIQTDKDVSYTAGELKHLDIDGNGVINAVDASAILSYYAYMATGGSSLLPAYLAEKQESDSGAVWEEVPEDTSGLKATALVEYTPFELEKVVEDTDLVFRGTVVGSKEYNVSRTDENGEKNGPIPAGIIEVKVEDVLCGQTDKETIKLYYPQSLRIDYKGSFMINDGSEYIFLAGGFDEEYNEKNSVYEAEKYADYHIATSRNSVMPVINSIATVYSGFFENNEEALAKALDMAEAGDSIPAETNDADWFMFFKSEDLTELLKGLFSK